MKKIFVLLAVGLVAACEPVAEAPEIDGIRANVGQLPEAVAELMAPDQDISRGVALRPEDGCYWYLYDGVVETTWIPLRARNGHRMCTRDQAGLPSLSPEEVDGNS